MEPQKSKSEITFFAKTNFRNKDVPFGIKTDDRRRHVYVIGKTGMGKTTLMENMIIQDIQNGHGVAFVDPHGDSVEKILNHIPNSRVNDVVYVNPADTAYPLAFNILETVDASYKHLVASGLMGVFTKIWADMWSARMAYILNNSILALLDSPGNTLLGIARILIDKKYRKKIVDASKDPVVRSFWMDEYANWSEKYRTEAIAAIQNKVGQFLSSGLIRNIIGQPKSTIDLREIMDNKKILLMNLSKGKVGEDNSSLLGAMMITKLQLAALSRVDLPEEERSDFYLYVDEFQNFATESFATILSEARKYRLNLTVGHQYIGQLVNEKNTKVRDAIFGNVGTIISFRVGAGDAEFLEKEFFPTFTENDLVNLPKYTVILKLMINGVASQPFTAVSLSSASYPVTGNAEKVIRVSRERYANPVQQVEEKISKWLGQDYQEQVAVVASAVKGDTYIEEEEEPAQQQAPKKQAAASMVIAEGSATPGQTPEVEMVELPEAQHAVGTAPLTTMTSADTAQDPAEQIEQAEREVRSTVMKSDPEHAPKPISHSQARAQAFQQNQKPRNNQGNREQRPDRQDRQDRPERRQNNQNSNSLLFKERRADADRRRGQGNPPKKDSRRGERRANPIWDQVAQIAKEKHRQEFDIDRNLAAQIAENLKTNKPQPQQQQQKTEQRHQQPQNSVQPAQPAPVQQPVQQQQPNKPEQKKPQTDPVMRNSDRIVLKPGETQKL